MIDIMNTSIPGLENYFFVAILSLTFYGLTWYIIERLYDSAKHTSLMDFITNSIFELKEYGTMNFISNEKTPLIITDLILYIVLMYFLRDTYLLAFQKLYPIDFLQFIIYATLGLILLPIGSMVIAFFCVVFNPSS
jgi:hypothetical protein